MVPCLFIASGLATNPITARPFSVLQYHTPMTSSRAIVAIQLNEGHLGAAEQLYQTQLLTAMVKKTYKAAIDIKIVSFIPRHSLLPRP